MFGKSELFSLICFLQYTQVDRHSVIDGWFKTLSYSLFFPHCNAITPRDSHKMTFDDEEGESTTNRAIFKPPAPELETITLLLLFLPPSLQSAIGISLH